MTGQQGPNQESTLSASPLYGVRVWRPGESPNDFLAGEREGQGQRTGAPMSDRGDRFRADPTSIRIKRSDSDLFTVAVKEALERMRFRPAEIGGRKVRMLVEQPFMFALGDKEP